MTFILDKYIKNYAEKTKEQKDSDTALHLKNIIPKTTHLAEKTYKRIIDEIIKEIESETDKDFKSSFIKVCRKYILRGDPIEAKLPAFLTRIILNESHFIDGIARNRSVSPGMEEPITIKAKDIINAVASKDRGKIQNTLENSMLHHRNNVVFATFDENNPESDPFINPSVDYIIRILALKRSSFKKDEPLTAVSLRYRNRDDVLKRFPVFTDAGWWDKFFPSDGNDKYGRTKPLDKSLRGVPEVVHENLKLAEVIEEIQFLKDQETADGTIEDRNDR